MPVTLPMAQIRNALFPNKTPNKTLNKTPGKTQDRWTVSRQQPGGKQPNRPPGQHRPIRLHLIQ